jgi:hypothetical protein
MSTGAGGRLTVPTSEVKQPEPDRSEVIAGRRSAPEPAELSHNRFDGGRSSWARQTKRSTLLQTGHSS